MNVSPEDITGVSVFPSGSVPVIVGTRYRPSKHVILKAKEAEHNMFKSDVFSAGLVLYQLAAMKDVGGFNQKTPECDGEVLIKEGLKQLSKSYSNKLVEVIRRMLIFNEEDRPTFQQMGMFIAGEDYVPRVDRTIMEQIEDFKKKKIEEKIGPGSVARLRRHCTNLCLPRQP